MTTRFFLIRHGATVLTAEDRLAGSTDVVPSDPGRHQVLCLAKMVFNDMSHDLDQPPRADGRLSKW